jgi:hypothetical protein
VLQEFWTINSPLQSTLILLVEHIAVALGAEFKIYLPQLMPQILRVLMHDTSKDRTVTIKVSGCQGGTCVQEMGFYLSSLCCQLSVVGTAGHTLLRLVMASAKFIVQSEDSIAFSISGQVLMRTVILSWNEWTNSIMPDYYYITGIVRCYKHLLDDDMKQSCDIYSIYT